MTNVSTMTKALFTGVAALLLAIATSEARAADDMGKRDHEKVDQGRKKGKQEPSTGPKKLGQTVEMKVTDKGFEPATVTVKKGEPVTLVITRTTDATCATDIVIDDYGINTKLPLNKAVTVTFTPKKAGDLQYGCAMGKMIGGVLKVQ